MRVKKLRLPRMFSLAYPVGPEPGGNAGAFRRFILYRSAELVLRITGQTGVRLDRDGKHTSVSTNIFNCQCDISFNGTVVAIQMRGAPE